MAELYKHNRVAYEKVMRHFADNGRAAVIQPCGTGKSFMGGAVASHFKNVLIVAPNEHVLRQASSTTPHGRCVTYSWLSRQDVLPTGFDLIWFDEFHRIGAETWNDGVLNLISVNPDAKILGTTATPERALERRDIAEEFFAGDVVSKMDLADAFAQHILRVPIYVIGVVSMADTKKDYSAKIKKAKRLNDDQKSKANAMLDNLIRDWSRSYGVPRILKKYIDKDVKRVVVFAQTINKLKEVRDSIVPWFNEAGIKVANVYAVHSAMDNAKEVLKAFEDDESDGVKVLISVDMLNEGIHVNRVDSVILLRSTISRNLYMQQIGRCFAVGQAHQPIILDLADNLTSACGYDGIYEARDRYIRDAGQYDYDEERPDWGDEFVVIDTLKETREVVAQLCRLTAATRNWDDDIKPYIEEFYDKHHRLPTKKDDESIGTYINMHRTEYYRNKFPERIEFLQQRGFVIELKKDYNPQSALDEVEAYYKENGCLPLRKDNTPLYKAIRVFMKKGRYSKEQVDRIDSLGITYRDYDSIWYEKYNRIKAIYDREGSIDSLKKADRSWIYSQRTSSLMNDEQKALFEAIGGYTLEKKRRPTPTDSIIAEVKAFVEKNGHLPTPLEDNHLYSLWHIAYSQNGSLWKRYLAAGISEEDIAEKKKTSFDLIVEFYEKNGRIPEKGEPLYRSLFMCTQHTKKMLRERLGFEGVIEYNFQKNFEIFKKWVIEHNGLPRYHAKEKEELRMKRWMTNNTNGKCKKHTKEVLEFCKGWGYRPQSMIRADAFQEDYEALKKYIEENNSLPTEGHLHSVYQKGRYSDERKTEMINKLCDPYRWTKQQKTAYDEMMAGVLAFFKDHGRKPYRKEDKKLYRFIALNKSWFSKGINRQYTDQLIAAGISLKIGEPSSTYTGFRNRVEAFLRENGRKPRSAEKKAYQDYNNFNKLHPEEMNAMLEKYVKKQ